MFYTRLSMNFQPKTAQPPRRWFLSAGLAAWASCYAGGMKSPSVPKLPPFEAPTLVFALFAVWSVVAYRASSPGYLLPAVLVALTAHLANKINRALRPLSKLELLPPDLPCNVARVESWLRARDQDEAPLEPGAESAVTWAVEEAKPTELCVVYLHGWGASPPELSPHPCR